MLASSAPCKLVSSLSSQRLLVPWKKEGLASDGSSSYSTKDPGLIGGLCVSTACENITCAGAREIVDASVRTRALSLVPAMCKGTLWEHDCNPRVEGGGDRWVSGTH